MTRSSRISARGFTLIELLVVIAIIALLISILLPALSRAREWSRVAKDQANLKSMNESSVMYFSDQDAATGGATPVIPWYRFPAHGGMLPGNTGGTYGITLFTPNVFGGFTAPKVDPADAAYVLDCNKYPVQIRPMNKFIAPEADGTNVQLDVYKCPSDKSHSTPIIGQSPETIEDEPLASWEVNGSSFCLNTRFMQGYTWATSGGTFSLYDVEKYAKQIAPNMIGGKASRFIMWAEQGFYSATYRAAPTLGQSLANPQRRGWHGQFSRWGVGFADGHAEYRYFDTRLSGGPDWTIWEPQ